MALPDSILWGDVEALASLLTTELNSLANTTMSSDSGTQDQDAKRFVYADFELVVTFGTAPVAGEKVLMYFHGSIDDTNFATSNVELTTHLAGIFLLDDVTSAQRILLRNIMLPVDDFKVALYNAAGQAMASSGNTLKMRRYAPAVTD